MRPKTLRRKLVTLGLTLALVLGAGVVVGVPRVVIASPVLAVTSPSVNVTAVSYSFAPNLIEQVPPNVTIHLNLLNADAYGAAHTFTIYKREGVVIGQNPNSPSTDISTLLYGTGTYDGNLFDGPANGTGWFNMTFPAPATGWYEFVCTESGHYASGMYGFIAFGENLPANLTITVSNTGAGLAVFIIVGTIVTLTVIAIVLGFVVGRRRGSQFEMPPERLGYAEPPTPEQNAPLPPTPPHS